MKPYPWLKLFAEARCDPKLGILTLAERGVWVNLLMYASEQDPRGSFGVLDLFALSLEVAAGDEDVLASTLGKLKRIRSLVETADPSVLAFRTFGERQKRRASDEPEATRERKAKQRDRERVSRVTGPKSRRVTRDVTEKADVTTLDIRYKREEEDTTPSGIGVSRHTRRGASQVSTPSAQQALFAAIVEACDVTGPLTESARKVVGKAARELADVGATPEQVRERVARSRQVGYFPAIKPGNISANWSTMTQPPQRATGKNSTSGATMEQYPVAAYTGAE